MSNQASGTPANQAASAGGMAGQQATLSNNLPTSVNSMGGGQPTNSMSFNSETQVLDKKRLCELVKEVDPAEQLDEDVEDVLLQIADDFIEHTVSQACALAKHRKANNIDVRDVQIVLERNWNMWIPGFGTEELRPFKRNATTEAHKQRMAVIKKALKKY